MILTRPQIQALWMVAMEIGQGAVVEIIPYNGDDIMIKASNEYGEQHWKLPPSGGSVRLTEPPPRIEVVEEEEDAVSL